MSSTFTCDSIIKAIIIMIRFVRTKTTKIHMYTYIMHIYVYIHKHSVLKNVFFNNNYKKN